MKTLDELIDAMERCIKTNCFDCNGCPYEDDDAEIGCRSDDKDADALQYLRWYKELADDSEAFNEWKENPPLTWEQLKQMEGKPVWVEISGKGAWDIIWRVGRISVDEDHDTWMWFYRGDKLPKTTYDCNGWQAYGKERS